MYAELVDWLAQVLANAAPLTWYFFAVFAPHYGGRRISACRAVEAGHAPNAHALILRLLDDLRWICESAKEQQVALSIDLLEIQMKSSLNGAKELLAIRCAAFALAHPYTEWLLFGIDKELGIKEKFSCNIIIIPLANVCFDRWANSVLMAELNDERYFIKEK